MRALLTQKLVNGLRPQATIYEVHDTKLRGLLLRVLPSGVMSFNVLLGRAKRVTIGRYPACTIERARALALDALQAGQGGASTAAVKALVRPDKADAVTVRTFVERTYRPWLEAHRKTGGAEAARLVASFGKLLDRPLTDLNAWIVEQWRKARLTAGASATTVNRDLTSFKAMLRRAVEWGTLDSYPLGKVKPLKTDARSVVRFLSATEEVALRSALDARDAKRSARRASGNAWRAARGQAALPDDDVGHLRPLVLLALNTGLRRGELLNLRWQDVDLKRRLLTVSGAGAKSQQTRHLPLSDEAHAVLAAWGGAACDPTALVFPGREGRAMTTLKTAWATLLVEAKIEAFRFHDLRHTFASKLVMAGVDLNTVRELLGHSTIEMTLRYAHLAPDHLADAIGRLKPVTAARASAEAQRA